MKEHTLLTYPTWERYSVLAHAVFSLDVRERRQIFQMSRSRGSNMDIFFPKFGITFAEFSVWYTLCDVRKKGGLAPP